ncbi:MAG: hypothetical protein LBF60_06715 [Treponema sp.]|jgi:hypothetical protein|nr:hypothetical protein [Treponema sp.]
MAVNNELDPELAALLADSLTPQDEFPEYPDALDTILGISQEDESGDEKAAEVNLNADCFPHITKRFADEPLKVFDEPLAYYKEAVSDTGESGARLHNTMQKYIGAKDPKDRSVFRQQLIPLFWEIFHSAARRAGGAISDPKKFLLRYGILHPQLLDAEQRTLFSKIIIEKEYDLPIYYMDEWFKAVGDGVIRNSTSDEVKVAKSARNDHQRQLLEKAQGKIEGIKNLLKNKTVERMRKESSLKEDLEITLQRQPSRRVPDASECYSERQRGYFSILQDALVYLLRVDREMASMYKELSQVEDEMVGLRAKIAVEKEAGGTDMKAVDAEFETVRQMSKMSVGRQGNHFPILTKEYFHNGVNEIGSRENVIAQLAWVESIDPEAFCRMYRNRLNRIIPYVALLPNYGYMGVCWEPFDRYNRATSRARIAIPMYPKKLQTAVLSAVADLRWQIAKEKAAYYWMEEGLTGYYYQWFIEKKLKGDVKEAFIDDYITWITKESEGTQKLDKELRGIFWRYLPFAQPIKEKLKTRSSAYQELYQRDVNRAMSDGY